MKTQRNILRVSVILSFLLICLHSFPGYGQTKRQGIHFFNGTWRDAIEKAKKQNKPLFFDAFASWCGPCRTMDSVVYSDPVVASFFNERFICIRVDMEKGEGPTLAKQFRSIDGYPSLLFISSDGHVIKTILGSRTPEVLIEEAKLALVN